MKIFYAVQATGNGHISRAMELLPYLEQYGEVDIFLSGDNSNLDLDGPVKYRSKGISLYYNCNGGLSYWNMFKRFQPLRVRQEIRDLPVEKYDLVLNDFDYITSAACAKKGIPSIHFGHQASFLSVNTPRPDNKNSTGEWLLKNFVKATHYAGLHFKPYDDFIFTAVVKKEILQAEPTDKGFITVYLPSYCEPQLKTMFSAYPELPFHIFSKETSAIRNEGNITFYPISRHLFTDSLIHCHGIISGAGFETPAEALHLGKKIMAIPIKGQYEQQCNAAALTQMGIPCFSTIDQGFPDHFEKWVNSPFPEAIDYSDSIPSSLEYVFSLVDQEHQIDAA
ncbi:MAG: glycosyl transferase [Chitinophagales bacterium]|nr:glycosyl transferase [Chitinophagales bacterium]